MKQINEKPIIKTVAETGELERVERLLVAASKAWQLRVGNVIDFVDNVPNRYAHLQGQLRQNTFYTVRDLLLKAHSLRQGILNVNEDEAKALAENGTSYISYSYTDEGDSYLNIHDAESDLLISFVRPNADNLEEDLDDQSFTIFLHDFNLHMTKDIEIRREWGQDKLFIETGWIKFDEQGKQAETGPYRVHRFSNENVHMPDRVFY